MITLVRHGPVCFDSRAWAQSSALRRLIGEYDTAPLRTGPVPAIAVDPDALIVCSDLRRSTASALAVFGRFDVSDSIFREADLPDLPRLGVSMPPAVLFAVARVLWIMGRTQGGELRTEFTHRCAEATGVLIRHHAEGKDVVLMGHGILNRGIAKHLRQRGFEGPRPPGASHWSVARFHPPNARV